MKKFLFVLFALATACYLTSCAMAGTPRDRTLHLSGDTVSETEYGGVVRWLAVDKYNSRGDGGVRFQVGYFLDNEVGFVLYEGGTRGQVAHFYRQGLNLRWDWGDYAIVMKPDKTCLYYDFSYKSTDVKPSGIFECSKF